MSYAEKKLNKCGAFFLHFWAYELRLHNLIKNAKPTRSELFFFTDVPILPASLSTAVKRSSELDRERVKWKIAGLVLWLIDWTLSSGGFVFPLFDKWRE